MIPWMTQYVWIILAIGIPILLLCSYYEAYGKWGPAWLGWLLLGLLGLGIVGGAIWIWMDIFESVGFVGGMLVLIWLQLVCRN